MEYKAEIVEAISNGRCSSSKDLTDKEVITYLNEKNNKKEQEWSPKGGDACNQKRRKIIALFKSMGKTVQDAKSYCENLRGFSKSFNDYNSKELSQIISIVEREKQKSIEV
jgi:hypothetical protein